MNPPPLSSHGCMEDNVFVFVCKKAGGVDGMRYLRYQACLTTSKGVGLS